MPKFEKGSVEAKEWAKKMANARAVKAGTRTAEGVDEKVNIMPMGKPKIVIPEWFATRSKKGWKLVNPITQERNLSHRNNTLSVKILRKPVSDAVILDGEPEPINLALFTPKDRAIIRETFDKIEVNSNKSVAEKPIYQLGDVEERGRPEILPKNIRVNNERKAEAKKALVKKRGRPSKYNDDEEARKQAKKDQDREANIRRTEKRRQAKLQGKGLSDSESDDEELSAIMDRLVVDSGKKKKVATKSAGGGESKAVSTRTAPIQVIQRPIAHIPQVNKGTKRKAESPDAEGKGLGDGKILRSLGDIFTGKASVNEYMIFVASWIAKKLLYDTTTKKAREILENRFGLTEIWFPILRLLAEGTRAGFQSAIEGMRHRNLNPRVFLEAVHQSGELELPAFREEEAEAEGKGMEESPIDWEDIKWGSFSRQFKEYNRTAKKPIKDLEKFANMIMKKPEKFQSRTIKRARFYLNVLMKKQKNNISTTIIEMPPKKSKVMKMDAGMGLYAGEPSGRGMYAGDGFFGDLAKSALKSGASMAVDAGANYAKNRLAGNGMYAGEGMYGTGMGAGCGGCGMCGGAIYNPNNDPEISKLNDHIRMVMGHHLKMGMRGEGIFGDIGRWFKKAGRTINKAVIKPVGKAFSKGGIMENVGKQVGGFALREGLPALANLASDAIGQPELGALATPLISKGADALARSAGVGMKKPNAWIQLVKRVQQEQGVSYKEAMSIASQMRRR